MELLSYETLNKLGYQGFLLHEGKERILQFGEGNFLRGFVDYFVDIANEKTGWGTKVVVFQPIPEGKKDAINDQEGLYTTYLRGLKGGQKICIKRIVSSISKCYCSYEDFEKLLEYARNPDIRFIISNTTEAGIVYDESSEFDQNPPSSFPGKVTRFLYERWKALGKEKGKGVIFLSVELIDRNGEELKRCVNCYIDQWKLEEEFKKWVNEENIFCNTMVDRIITGYPHAEIDKINEENGYLDYILVTGEVFAIWVIEGPANLDDELPFKKAGLPVIVVDDCSSYKLRKVRMLNGIQTTATPLSYLCGFDIMRKCMDDPVISSFMERTVCNEIIPVLPFSNQELNDYATELFDRLKNPFIDHRLLAISLNTTSKWKARVLPTVKEYTEKFNQLPLGLVMGFAGYIQFYRGKRMENNRLLGKRGEKEYEIKDDQYVLEFYFKYKDDSVETLVDAVCSNEKMWGEDLRKIPGFKEQVICFINDFENKGVYSVISELMKCN